MFFSDILNYFLTYVALLVDIDGLLFFWLTAEGASGGETAELDGKFRVDTATNGA